MRHINLQEQIYDEMIAENKELAKELKRQTEEHKRLVVESKKLHQIIREADLSV